MTLAKSIWGEDFPIPGLDKDQTESVWIVVPGKRRQSQLRRQIRTEGLQSRVRVLVQGALDRLLAEAMGLRGTSLGDAQTHALLSHLLEAKRDVFQMLHQLVPATRTEDHVAPGVAVRLREMLDNLRLNEAEDQLLTSSVDESGAIREDRRLNFELHTILEAYEHVLTAGGWEESISLRRRLAEALEADNLPDGLADVLVLDQPSHLYPLDQRLWQSLARLRPLYVVLDESIVNLAERLTDVDGPDDPVLAPSERHIGPLAGWLNHVRRRLGGICTLTDRSLGTANDLVRALFDGRVPERLDAPSLVLWREHDRRREVELLVRLVKRGLLDGRFQPSQIQIVAPYLDPYLPLLRRAFAEAGVPCSLPKGEPLWGSAPAAVLRAFLRWAETGSSADMAGYLGNPAVRWPRIAAKEIQSFCDRYAAKLPPFPAAALETELTSWSEYLSTQTRSLLAFRLDEEARRARVPGGPDFVSDWANPMLAYIQGRFSDKEAGEHDAGRLAGVLADLAALEHTWSRISLLRSRDLDPLEGLAVIRGRLREDQAMTGLLRHSLGESDPGARFLAEVSNADRALGEIGRLFRQVEDLIRFRREELHLEDRGFSTLRNFLLEHLRNAHLSRAPQRDSVLATELLDTRTERYEMLFVLGLTQSEFPPLELESYLLPDGLPSHLAKPLDGTQEAVWLLGRLLRSSSRIVLSCPRTTEEGPALASTPMEDLVRWREQGRARLGEQESTPPDWVASFEELSRRDPRHPLLSESVREAIAAGTTALEARTQPLLTPFDGAIGQHPMLDEHRRLYSVSQLETFRECPHRYLFQHVLRLRALADIPSELEENRIGTLVHAALAQFFGEGGPWQGRRVDLDNFDEACTAMLEVARKVLVESAVDWDSGPVLQAQRLEILRGLQEPGDQGKRGYLKAALAFQRDLIGTLPYRCEYEFGQGETPPLELPGGVQVSGTIDRVDIEGDELRVWDYKTGSVQKLSDGGSLQIPVYAEVARRQLAKGAPDRLQIRGGFIALKKRNQRDKADSLSDGALVEDLAVEKVKNRWQLSPSAAAIRIQEALDEVVQIDAKIHQGRLHQIDETPEVACQHCDYNPICERDEARLKDKLEPPPIVVPRAKPDTREIVERLGAAVQSDLFAEDGSIAPGALPPKELKPPPPLSEEQQGASDVDQSVVLTAGAGSGKTFVLKTRVARLVRRGIGLDKILAITFTRKAAEEVRSRIASALGEALERGEFDGEPLDEDQRSRLVDARALLPAAALTTIHGLCQQILRMDPLLSEYDDRAKVLGEAHLLEIQNLAVEASLSGQSECADTVLRLLDGGLRLDELKTGLRDLIRDEHRLVSLERSMGSRSEGEWRDLCLRIYRQQVEAKGRELDLELRPWLHEFQQWLETTDEFGKKASKSKVDAQEKSLHFHQVYSWLRTIVLRVPETGWEAQLQQLEELKRFLQQNNDSQIQARGGKRNFWKELREILDDVKWPSLSLAFERENAGINLSRDVCRVAREALKQYVRLKQERAVIDHDDQLTRSYRMLCGRFDDPKLRQRQTSLITRLRGKFTHILVDEFQDTDPRQWELLQALVGPRALAGESTESTVFIVGDRKQAIYGFRGGENRVFEEAKDHLAGRGARVRSLQDNYRSGPQLIAGVNALFHQLFSSEFEGGDPRGRRLVETAVPPERMRAAKSGEGAEGTMSLLLLPYEKGNRGEKKVREALLVARLVRGALNGEVPQYADLVRARTEGPVIGILCRKVRELMLTAEALDRCGVHYTVSHGSGFFSLPEIRALENALRAIADDRNAISMAGVLRGPLFGLSDRDLLDAAHALGPFWTRKVLRGNWDDPRGKRVHARLVRWRRAAAVCSTSALLSLIIADAGLAGTYEALGRQEAIANLEKLVDLVYREERVAGGTGLVEVIHWFELQRQSFEGPALKPGGQAPVTLMTVHGAKGLEFPMVILPYLEKSGRDDRDFVFSELPANEGPLLGMQVEEPESSYKRRATFLSQFAEETEKKRGSSEEKRLFYVACTRARRHLVLTMTESAKFWDELVSRGKLAPETKRRALADGGDARTWMTHLLQLPEGAPTPPTELILNDPQGQPLKVGLVRPTDLPEAEAVDRAGGLIAELDTAGLSASSQGPQHVMAASQLHLLQQCPLAYYLGRVAGLLSDADTDALVSDEVTIRPSALDLGDAVHRLLEATGGAVLGILEAAPAQREVEVRRLLLQALEEEPSESMVQQVTAHLTRLFSQPRWREVLEHKPAFEVPLETKIQQSLLEGAIDAVHTAEDGSLVLHDFNPAELRGLKPQQVAEQQGYERQLQAYAIAAELMGLGSASEAVLWFTAHGGGPVSVGMTEEHLAQAQQILAKASELSGMTLGQAREQARTEQCSECRFRPICPEAFKPHPEED